MAHEFWSPIATEYNPILCGSIDGTDTVPHDRGIIRALNSRYRPNKGVVGDPHCTVFVGRLNHCTREQPIKDMFAAYGDIRRMRLVRDVVTGFSKGYAFIEYFDVASARRACHSANGKSLDDRQLLVEMECERTMPGWVPRRLGGGFGGRKESGQLRFGGKDRPFRKPIFVPPHSVDVNQQYDNSGQRKHFNDRHGDTNSNVRSRSDNSRAYDRSKRNRSRSPHT